MERTGYLEHTNINMSSETSPQREILANIGISFKVRQGRRGGGHSSAPDGESLCREVSEKRDQEQRQSRQGRRLGVSHRDLSNTRKKKNHPSLHGQRRRHGDSFELQRSVTHMGEGGRWVVCRRRGARVEFQHTVLCTVNVL